MSDTKTVREACEHGKYAKHEWLAHDGFMPRYERCDGGKEIVFHAIKLGAVYDDWEYSLPVYVVVEE